MLNSNVRHNIFYDNLSKEISELEGFENISQNLIMKDIGNDHYYKHLTLKVHSLCEYISIINVISYYQYSGLVFRGMKDSSFELLPSLNVYDPNEDITFPHGTERFLVNEMLTIRADEFDNIKTDFELLAKMQHFGLPTRLLDFSFNPLVALYFACESETSKDGRVVFTRDTSPYCCNHIIEKICSTYRIEEFASLFVEDVLNEKEINEYFLMLRSPIFKKPPYTNERIKRQSAIFMIFPNEIVDEVSQAVKTISKGSKPVAWYLTNESGENRIQIAKENEDTNNLYCEDYCTCDGYSIHNIEEIYISKGLLTDYDIEHHGDKYKQLFHKRFTYRPTISYLPSYLIENCFCSIVIPHDCKKRIIKELNQININEAFLFPELEYTAKQIKREFQKQLY